MLVDEVDPVEEDDDPLVAAVAVVAAGGVVVDDPVEAVEVVAVAGVVDGVAVPPVVLPADGADPLPEVLEPLVVTVVVGALPLKRAYTGNVSAEGDSLRLTLKRSGDTPLYLATALFGTNWYVGWMCCRAT